MRGRTGKEKGRGIMTRARNGTVLSLFASAFLTSLLAFFSPESSGVELENLELIFQKSYSCQGGPIDTLYAFGRSISSAGDVNGDGYDDIVAAAAWRDSGFPAPYLSIGFVFLGGDPMDTLPDVILTGDHDGEARVEVSGVGDVNSDGFDDVVMSNHGDQGVRLFFGGNPMDSIYDVLLMNGMTSSFANSLSPAGDVNGDGFADIVVGNYMSDWLNGSAAIFFGGPSIDGWPDVLLTGNRGEGFGMSVAGGGDVNCDGYDDVVVGEWDNSEFAISAGKIYIFFGGDPMDNTPDVWMFGEGAGHILGAGDLDIVNVDTLCDWVVAGTQFYPDGVLCPGKVYVLYGDTVMDGVPDAVMVGRHDSTGLGISTKSAGHITDSGYEGIISGAVDGNGFLGNTYLWLSGIPFDTVPDGIVSNSYVAEVPGWRVASAGDVNGDGFDEIMFSNYATWDSFLTVWVCKYTGTGVFEEPLEASSNTPAALMQNRPNPIRNSTIISYSLSATTQVTLSIYDITGRLVETLVNETQQPGMHQVHWNRATNPSGVYFYQLKAGEFMETRKMMVVG